MKKMKKIKLMNSAIMPHSGIYIAEKITFADFVSAVKSADEIESYIGYEQNAELIEKWTGRKIPVNRAQTTFQHGDVALVMKLECRVADPKTKGALVDENDFEFFRVTVVIPENGDAALADWKNGVINDHITKKELKKWKR